MMLALLILAAICAFSGCALLALSQARHWQAVTGEAAVAPGGMRKAGWSLLFSSFALCILRDGASFAILFWPLLLMASALGVALLLTWRPVTLRWLAQLGAARSKDHR